MTEASHVVFDESQQAALHALATGNGPVLVTGGPGTGKTTVLIEAVRRAVGAGTPLEQIVVLTHTRSAAQDLRRRIIAAVGRSVIAPRITTLHGFALSLQRKFGALGDEGSPTLLTGPDHDYHVRELIEGGEVERWPTSLRAAASTKGFAAEVRAFTTRARQLGLDPDDLVARGAEQGRADWVAVGEFFREYLNVLGFENRIDYAELVHATRLLLTDDHVRQTIRDDVAMVFCDEFAELDQAGVALLGQLQTLGVGVAAYADPSTSVYGFRGAIGARLDAFPANAIALEVNHRSEPGIQTCVLRIGARVSPVRPPVAHGDDGSVRAFSHASSAIAVGHIAHLLRDAYREGLAWADMAVITREAAGQVAVLATQLEDLGIPVDVEGDDAALGEQPAVAILLDAMRVTIAMAAGEPAERRSVARLLSSPMCGLDAGLARLAGRELRARSASAGVAVSSSDDLRAEALIDGVDVGESDGLARVQALGDLLRAQARLVADGANPHTVAWNLWSGTEWPSRLEQAALGQGRGAPRANRDLDAMVAAFDVMAKVAPDPGSKGLQKLIDRVELEEVAGDTARESDPRQRGVAVVTAHRTKGLEWPFVIVTSLEEGQWPAGRMPSSLLDIGSLSQTAGAQSSTVQPVTLREVIDGERRAFLLAISRAQHRLVVCGVGTTSDDSLGLSRFIGELGVEITEVDQTERPSTLPALVAELRRASVDPTSSPALRDAAADQLAVLATAADEAGRPLVPDARPDRWWGLGVSAEAPTDDEMLTLSVSDVEGILTCPRQWFLNRRAEGAPASSTAMRFGSIIHLLAEQMENGHMTRADADALLDDAFAELEFTAPWESAGQRAAASEALARLELWLTKRPGTLLDTERRFNFTTDVDGAPVTIKGMVDRLERDDEGRLKIIDFKTGKYPPSLADTQTNVQLGLYQWAITEGCFDDVAPGDREPAPPELIFLRLGKGLPTRREQASLTADPTGGGDLEPGTDHWVQGRLREAVRTVRGGEYLARSGPACTSCAFSTGCPASTREVRGDV